MDTTLFISLVEAVKAAMSTYLKRYPEERIVGLGSLTKAVESQIRVEFQNDDTETGIRHKHADRAVRHLLDERENVRRDTCTTTLKAN